MNNADSVPDPANPVPPTNRLAQYEHVHRIVETSDQLMLEIDADGHIKSGCPFLLWDGASSVSRSTINSVCPSRRS
ncbi:MAG: hypothetical protein ACUVSW_09245 [Roseiflexus sp.]